MIELTRQMKTWLEKQNGFVSYELYEGETSWADRIVWSTLEDAKHGNEAFLETEIYREMEKLFEKDYRGMVGREVLL